MSAVDPVEGLVRSLPLRLRREQVAGWRARFHCTFSGADTADWTIVIDDGSCRVDEGHHGNPDCALRMDQETFLGIENGSVDPKWAFLFGKIRVSNLEELLRFVRAFRRADR